MENAKKLNSTQSEQSLVGSPGKKRRTRPLVKRAHTIPIKKMTKEQLRIGKIIFPKTDHEFPEKREQCSNAERPCPFVSCKHHLYLDVNKETGSIKINFPDIEVWEMAETCTLDITSRGGITLEEVGKIMNLTRERIRQLEMSGLTRLVEMSKTGEIDFSEFRD